MKAKYTNRRCQVCRQGRDFKYLDQERDIFERTLMVCTSCNSKMAVPGQRKPTWKELLKRDEDSVNTGRQNGGKPGARDGVKRLQSSDSEGE